MSSPTGPVGKQVQVWISEVGLGGARNTTMPFEDACADTIVFVLDEERDPNLIAYFADAVRDG
jgi:hypothetical protein